MDELITKILGIKNYGFLEEIPGFEEFFPKLATESGKMVAHLDIITGKEIKYIPAYKLVYLPSPRKGIIQVVTGVNSIAKYKKEVLFKIATTPNSLNIVYVLVG